MVSSICRVMLLILTLRFFLIFMMLYVLRMGACLSNSPNNIKPKVVQINSLTLTLIELIIIIYICIFNTFCTQLINIKPNILNISLQSANNLVVVLVAFIMTISSINRIVICPWLILYKDC